MNLIQAYDEFFLSQPRSEVRQKVFGIRLNVSPQDLESVIDEMVGDKFESVDVSEIVPMEKGRGFFFVDKNTKSPLDVRVGNRDGGSNGTYPQRKDEIYPFVNEN